MIATARRLTGAMLAALCLVAGMPALAQNVDFHVLLAGRECTRALVLDGWLYTGLDTGGVVAWSLDDPNTRRTFSPDEGLSGFQVTDLAWTGANLWVATANGGLTRISDPASATPAMRPFTSNLASLTVTAVSGVVVGSNERVWYGTSDRGIGVIVNGLPGGYFTVLDGLVDDHITDIAVSEDAVYVATPSGVSRFADNTFATLNSGLTDITVARLTFDDAGDVYAATDHGVLKLNPTNDTWELVYAPSNSMLDVAVTGGVVWAMNIVGRVFSYDNGTISQLPLVDLPSGATARLRTMVVDGSDVWVAGRFRDAAMEQQYSEAAYAMVARYRDAAWTRWEREASIVADADGAGFDTLGRAWIGERGGDGLSSWSDERGWFSIYQLASVANDSSGLLSTTSDVASILHDPDGSLWFLQYTSGVIRVRFHEITGEDRDTYDIIYPGNSALVNPFVVRLGVHPDGAIFVMSDENSPVGVEVISDPDHWRDDRVWVRPDVGGTYVAAALVERRDVVWFAVRGVGLVRWDINGLAAGPNDQLTWTDTSDDDIAPALTTIPGGTLSITQTEALALGDDGTIWVGGNGVVGFRYDPVLRTATLVKEYRQKLSASDVGLFSLAVTGIALDRNGDLWALTDAGLNRIRMADDQIDSYTDIASFLSRVTPGYYSANIVSALPGGTYRQLKASDDRSQLVLSSDLGGAVVSVGERAPQPTGSLAALYLYPNPLGGGNLLSIGGLNAGTAAIEIVNLLGQVVFHNDSVDLGASTGFWDGTNRYGDLVASGLYVVKVTYEGKTAVRTLAVAN